MAIVYVQRNGGGAIIGVYAVPQPGLAEEPIDDQTAEVLAYLHGKRPRMLAAILTDIQALTGPQQTAVWADLLSGSPAKWRTMSNDPCVWAKASQAATSTLEKQVAVAFFVRENPAYLVNPTWWPPSGSGPVPNLPGDEPNV